ncbi:formylglycine-generating enzyme family protein [Croceiramulus getboli]|nr:formylglycine-generating enzyme family protein [Flavobacteriaceae bacterium YJPT1-3]
MPSEVTFTVFRLALLVSMCCSLAFSCQQTSPSPVPEAPDGMIWVAPKTFIQGAKKDDQLAMPGELSGVAVQSDGFFIDATEVTNAMFKKFVEATGYTTVAERPIDWEELKKELPQGTPKPNDSLLQPGSLVFRKEVESVSNLQDYSQWWEWRVGANWRHPEGPQSSIEDQDDFPVVHIAYEDALAYCAWANRRLPTEKEWEAAAQGTYDDAIYTWGHQPDLVNENANTWQGQFPIKNEPLDGFKYLAPVKSYVPNTVGIHDMLGNAWEITSSNYSGKHEIESANEIGFNSKETQSFETQKVIKGGSYLCNASYCASYRISARMPFEVNSSSDHIGFRTVATTAMLNQKK